MKFSAQHQAAWPEPWTKSRGGFGDDEEDEALASRTSRSQAPSRDLTKRRVTDEEASTGEEAEAIVEFLGRLLLIRTCRSARGKEVLTGRPRASFRGASIAEEVRVRAGRCGGNSFISFQGEKRECLRG